MVDTQREMDRVSKMDKRKKEPRARRKFTPEYKEGAVRLVLDENKTVGQVARDLDLTASALGAASRAAIRAISGPVSLCMPASSPW